MKNNIKHQTTELVNKYYYRIWLHCVVIIGAIITINSCAPQHTTPTPYDTPYTDFLNGVGK